MRGTLLTLLTALLAFAAAAQDRPQIEVPVHSVIARFDPPPWSTTDDLEDTSEIFRHEGEGTAGAELIGFLTLPKGQSAENWKMVYAMVAESPVSGDFADYVLGEKRLLARKCTDVATFFERNLSPQARLLILHCAAIRDAPDTGEVSVFKMAREAETMVKLSQTFRVPAFVLDDVELKPPVAIDVLRAALVRVGRLSLTPVAD